MIQEETGVLERVAQLEEENLLLRRTIELQKRQMKHGSTDDEVRRLRAKLAEWEGSMPCINGGYYHGARFIRPYQGDGDA